MKRGDCTARTMSGIIEKEKSERATNEAFLPFGREENGRGEK